MSKFRIVVDEGKTNDEPIDVFITRTQNGFIMTRRNGYYLMSGSTFNDDGRLYIYTDGVGFKRGRDDVTGLELKLE